ncbi:MULTISPECIES: prepilin-type N-terminal cleavage/methylation domain-containing protein [Pseudomonas]|uniref:Prepilin-type N-terminal cleavage/methylation domain-containing protein n=1 Tax=Pseudomonas quercus TaxID=2722792 RepID=A0ABX0YJC0_9PSED|nr:MULTISPECIES: prepilin-type N-terminal cleavage/methylation domain-containing protein [Pseudomonas]MBF7143818.1 prepilin-type N-terminal cleavage/methylation domain-containing protein [Pseudomonas sp. LY10J]NJP02103.1 prepilin-type N-terminal cleavage/methylation domain-containing protein [Pseudomonas quercus]
MTRRLQGFTLLEMLVVLSLLAVLLTLAGGALVGANRAMAKAERYSTRLDEVRATQNFLRTALGQALPLSAKNAQGEQDAVFEGASDSLRFYAPLSARLGGGLYRYQVTLAKGRLQVGFAHLQGTGLQPFGEEQVLLHQVQALNLTYRGFAPDGQVTGWLDQWPWPSRLPRQVRIAIELAGPVPWPTQSVGLNLDLSTQAGLL